MYLPQCFPICYHLYCYDHQTRNFEFYCFLLCIHVQYPNASQRYIFHRKSEALQTNTSKVHSFLDFEIFNRIVIVFSQMSVNLITIGKNIIYMCLLRSTSEMADVYSTVVGTERNKTITEKYREVELESQGI